MSRTIISTIIWPWEFKEKQKIDGPAVVIDDISQSTNATILLEYITSKYYLVNKDNWKAALQIHPDSVLIGESVDPIIPFAVSNDPAKIYEKRKYLSQHTILHMSNNGTRRVQEAIDRGAQPLYAACFGNLMSIVGFIRSQSGVTHITIVPSGGSEAVFVDRRKTDLPEDRYCAQALQQLLLGKSINVETYITKAIKELPEYYIAEKLSHKTLDFTFSLPDRFTAVPQYTLCSDGLIEVTNAFKGYPLDTLKS